MTGWRGAFGVAIVVIATVAAGVLNASATKPRFASEISLHTVIEGDDFVFRGRVTSPEKRACKRYRKVTITAGHIEGVEPEVEGVTFTNRRGRYELRVMAATNTIGNYRARASRKVRPRFVCKRAVSEIVNPEPGPTAAG